MEENKIERAPRFSIIPIKPGRTVVVQGSAMIKVLIRDDIEPVARRLDAKWSIEVRDDVRMIGLDSATELSS
jgi:hypothetical protein